MVGISRCDAHRPLATDVLLGAIRHALERSRAALLYESEIQAVRTCYASLTHANAT